MSTTKLEKLLINEVSGVDVPANLLDGWMVSKATGNERGFGTSAPWEVGDAEARIREFTKATDAPNDAYASCYLWVNKEADAPAFGDFKFLVSDVVDGQIAIMPSALDAAEARLDTSSIPAEDKVEIAKTISALRERMGKTAEKDATSIVGKIKNLLLGKEIDVTKEELATELDARFESFGKSLVEDLAKSVAPAPAGEAAPEVPAGDAAPAAPAADASVETSAITADDLAKAIETAQQPLLEVLDKTLDRLEALERGGAVRKSVVGQEDRANDGDEPTVPTVKSAIAQALGRGAVA